MGAQQRAKFASLFFFKHTFKNHCDFKNNFYLFLATLGLHCYAGFSPAAVRGLLIAVVSPAVAPGLQSTGALVVACALHCPEAYGIFPDLGWNPCLLHWQADSLPLSNQESSAGLN